MEKINELEEFLGKYLIEIVPVPWTKICLYAECAQNYVSHTTYMREKETDVIVSSGFFYDRYDHYPRSEYEISGTLPFKVMELYNAYVEKLGSEKMWHIMVLVVEEDGSFHIDFTYEEPKGTRLQRRDAFMKKYFNAEFKHVKGKYPSAE